MKRYAMGLAALGLSLGLAAQAQTPVDLTGSGRVRWESKNNQDAKAEVDDQSQFVGSRFRLNVLARPSDSVHLFFQPQFTKQWGEVDVVGTETSNTNTVTGAEKATSGQLYDTGLDVHQAYLWYEPTESSEIWLGRQELAYGDHLVIGNVGWSNVGRAFDAARLRQKFSTGWADVFWSEIIDENDEANQQFGGLYTSFDKLGFLKALDLYALYQKQAESLGKSFATYGTRIKWVGANFDVTTEVTQQPELEDGAYQGRIEVGYSFAKASRVFLGYFQAGEEYRQLYPTAHKWLGAADYFSRRNITGFRLGGNMPLSSELSLRAEYLSFSRLSSEQPAYNFSGNALGTGAEEGDDIAQELDLSVKWNPSEVPTYVTLGASAVVPGKYIENVRSGSSTGSFVYVETGVTF